MKVGPLPDSAYSKMRKFWLALPLLVVLAGCYDDELSKWKAACERDNPNDPAKAAACLTKSKEAYDRDAFYWFRITNGR